jgi:hypothetical protein
MVERQAGEKHAFYCRTGTWPPPAEFFSSDAIGIQVFRRPDGQRIHAKAVIEGIPSLGLPTTADRDKYMAFMKISQTDQHTYIQPCPIPPTALNHCSPYSLDFFHDNPERAWADSVPNSCSTAKVEVPTTEGAFRDANGSTWAADMSLLRKTLDVSTMTQDWVKSTNDPLFADLERGERLLLYFYCVIGMPARVRAPRS